MSFFNKLFGQSNPRDVFKMPNNPSDFIDQLSRRKFWENIDLHLLNEIARHANGEMELLRNFVYVSEKYELVSNNFVNMTQNPEKMFGSPLLEFAFTLCRLGSTLCQQGFSIKDPEQKKFILISADMAFTSAILCDPFQLQAYSGMAFLYGEIHINVPIALEWCQKYKDAEEKFLSTPNERLTPIQISTKEMIQNPDEAEKTTREMAKHAPHLMNEVGASEHKPTKDLIVELEQKLIKIR